VNIILLVPNDADDILLAETALQTLKFTREVSSPTGQSLYRQAMINVIRHVLLIRFSDNFQLTKLKDYLPQASEVILMLKDEAAHDGFMAMEQANNVNTAVDNQIFTETWKFVVKTPNFNLLQLDFTKLREPIQRLFSIRELRGSIGGASYQNASVGDLQPQFTKFIDEWVLNSTVVLRIPQVIYLCFKFDPNIVRAFTEYAAIILAALEIEYVYEPVVVNGSVLVYIRCPVYIPWYILERKDDIESVLAEEGLIEIYECFISDVEVSMQRPGNEEFVEELTFLKELMSADGVKEKPTARKYVKGNRSMTKN
jgi:hypothetical protein